MNPAENPYTPGAGAPPYQLSGREQLISEASVSFARIHRGRSEQGLMLTGLRGVGKTVLLNRLLQSARDEGLFADLLEAPETGGLAKLVIPSLRRAALEFSKKAQLVALSQKFLRILKSFSLTMKISEADISLALDPEIGTADSGDMEQDLADLFEEVGKLAKAAGSGVALLIDELQYLSSKDYAALIVAAHRTTQRGLPMIVMGAGLPMLPGLSGNSKSYAERLFRFIKMGALPFDAASSAIAGPARDAKVDYTDEALREMFEVTKGYPYFLQEWGHVVWNTATQSPITLDDVKKAHPVVLSKLDESFFFVRLDRVIESEKRYLRGLAELGPGAHEASRVAAIFGRKVTSFGPVRDALIKKGMIFSPKYGFIEFTVPLFDEYLRRALPLIK